MLNTHADVDHFGGNAASSRGAAGDRLPHVADCEWIGDRERILRERYGWYAAHGADADYDADTKDWLRNALGQMCRSISTSWAARCFASARVSRSRCSTYRVTRWDVGLWDPLSRSAIITDATLGAGLLNNEGE